MKRQKIEDNFFDSQTNREKNAYALMRNITIGGQDDVQSVGMLENQTGPKDQPEPTHEEFNVDDMLITRNEQTSSNSMNFFGLACVFGAIGMVSVLTDSPVDLPKASNLMQSGSKMVGTDKIMRDEPISMTN